MSRVSVSLSTSSDSDTQVTLTGARVSLTNLYTSGTVALGSGAVTASSKTASAISLFSPSDGNGTTDSGELENYLVVPQTIGNDARLTVTLSDASTYSLQLNTCTVSGGSTAITSWEGGKSYSYSVKLQKKQASFMAYVQSWSEKSSSFSTDDQ